MGMLQENSSWIKAQLTPRDETSQPTFLRVDFRKPCCTFHWRSVTKAGSFFHWQPWHIGKENTDISRVKISVYVWCLYLTSFYWYFPQWHDSSVPQACPSFICAPIHMMRTYVMRLSPHGPRGAYVTSPTVACPWPPWLQRIFYHSSLNLNRTSYQRVISNELYIIYKTVACDGAGLVLARSCIKATRPFSRSCNITRHQCWQVKSSHARLQQRPGNVFI